MEGMDRVWRLAQKSLSESEGKRAAEEVASGYEGLSLEVEREAEDCLSFFFSLPVEGESNAEIELSIYDLGGGKIVLSQEPDAGDHQRYWEEACQLAEDMAEALSGESVDL